MGSQMTLQNEQTAKEGMKGMGNTAVHSREHRLRSTVGNELCGKDGDRGLRFPKEFRCLCRK